MQIFLTSKNTKTLFLMLLLTSITYTFTNCKKDRSFLQNKLALNKSAGSFSSYYSFDASHNVLVFEKFSDVEALEDALDNYENNYPYNRGNDHLIYVTLDSIKNFGWTNGNNPNTNKVKIGNFVSLLEDSYPLSDTVLKEILWTHDVVNPSFAVQLVKPIFEQNASFSYEVRTEITESNLPNGIKNQILNKDDNTVMIPNFAYDDFLAEIPSYMSLYKTLETQERINLESGMDPADPNFDNDIIRFDFERLVMNFNHEIYIQGYLFKLYDSCKLAIFKGSIPEAYASLAMLDNYGNVTTPNISETNNGIPLSQMADVFPMNTVIVSSSHDIVERNPRKGQEGLISFQNIHAQFLDGRCPLSYFNFTRDSANNKLYFFDSYTDLNYTGEGAYYQYWDFGDGTGSFQTDPEHVYQEDGVYEVVLTTFNDDCGCWDVNKTTIGVGTFEKSCNVVPTLSHIKGSSENQYIFKLGLTNTSSGFIDQATIFTGDGSSYPVNLVQAVNLSTLFTFSHTYQNSPNVEVYSPYVEYTLSNGCNPEAFYFTPIIVDRDNSNSGTCCDNRDKNPNTKPLLIDNKFQLKTKSSFQGRYIAWLHSPKIKGKQTFYEKRTLFDGWKEEKCIHYMFFTGTYSIKYSDGCATKNGIRHPNGGDQVSVFALDKKKLSQTHKLHIPDSKILDAALTEPDEIFVEHRISYTYTENNTTYSFVRSIFYTFGCDN